jgi:hypothetical protein
MLPILQTLISDFSFIVHSYLLAGCETSPITYNVRNVFADVGSVEGLAFDYLHKDLYFTSYSNHSLMRVSVADPFTTTAGSYPKPTTRLLVLNDQDKPRGIAVDPCEMYV